MFLFGEVTYQMIALPVVLGQHVEQKRLHVVIQRLVVQKQLRQQTKVLTVNLVCVAVHLKDRNVVAAIDFRSRWMPPGALVLMPLKNRLTFGVL